MNSKTAKPQANVFSMDDFAKALEAEKIGFTNGEIIKGKIQGYDTNGIYVEIGGKSLAFVPGEEIIADLNSDLSALFPIGEEQEFLIIKEQDADGQVTLSCKQLQLRQAWNQADEIQSNKQSVTVRVTGVNKGGVTIDFQATGIPSNAMPCDQTSESAICPHRGIAQHAGNRQSQPCPARNVAAQFPKRLHSESRAPEFPAGRREHVSTHHRYARNATAIPTQARG